MAKKWFVIDTSVYLSDSECLTRFDNNDIIVPKSREALSAEIFPPLIKVLNNVFNS